MPNSTPASPSPTRSSARRRCLPFGLKPGVYRPQSKYRVVVSDLALVANVRLKYLSAGVQWHLDLPG
jgi:hypothetical protein